MHIDIFSDTICPWCYIGKRRFDRALAERPQPGLTVRWRAFQLNPDMPAEGMDRQRYLQLKFGGPENAQSVYSRIREAGQDDQIPFAFEAIERTPNTIASHRLIAFASDRGDPETVIDRLFEAYFLRGENIGDLDVLVAAAEAGGLDPAETRAFLESEVGLDAIRQEDARAREIGIQGVPTFIVNNKYVLSGAHPPEVLFQLFDLARQDEPEPAEAAN